ncbi:MAG: Acetamidase [Sclerophora amabilis]|nr:MAG: Acetamidase [Sclerophora amabilis]
MDWEKVAKTKRDSVNALIPEDWQVQKPIPSADQQRDVTGKYIQEYLNAKEIEITETDAAGIVQRTCAGEWKARDVTEAFCHRAAIAHQLVNCLHEIFFDGALQDAQRLDDYYATHKRPIGPLHGLPISLKDQFHVKGVETTMGYVGWIGTFQGQKNTGKERVFESEMVKELKSMGAVLYCKTSVPHTLMTGETVNNIIGYTWNPKNRHLSSGGSSGGEGALVGLKGSPLGFGTDIGGSIRIPAVFNGLYGIKPSAGRLPYEGMANSMDGQNSMLSVVGPIAHSPASLRLVIKSVLSQQPWLHDPLVHELPWRNEQEDQIMEQIKAAGGGAGGLAFGVLRHDGTVMPQPPVRRAIDVATGALQKMGHKIVEWNPPSHERGNAIALTTYMYDGGKDIYDALALSGEPVVKQLEIKEAFEQMNGSKIAATNVQKREYQKDYMEYWNGTKDISGTGRPVEAFIMPLAPFPAARPETFKYYGYSTIVNLLDYTAVVVPVTRADKTVDLVDADYKPINDYDKAVWEHYDPEIYDGAHVGVQIVGRRLQEEKVLVLAEIIGEALAKDGGRKASL